MNPKPLPTGRVHATRMYSLPTEDEDGAIRFESLLKNMYIASRGSWKCIAGTNHRSGSLFHKGTSGTVWPDGHIWRNEGMRVSIGNEWYPFAARPFGEHFQRCRVRGSGPWFTLGLPYPLGDVQGLSERLGCLDASGSILLPNAGHVVGLESKLSAVDGSGAYTGPVVQALSAWSSSDGSYTGPAIESSKISMVPMQRNTEFVSSLTTVGFHSPRARTFPRCPKAYLATPGSTSTILDLRVNGVTILQSPLVILSGSYVSSASSLVSASSAEDDRIDVVILQAGSGAKGLAIDWPL